MRIAVIGGGWYGCHIGSELIRQGHEVVIYERSAELFTGSSGYNQFRLHLGFHYPRSSKTRHQIIDSHQRFLSKYPNLFFPVTTNVYGISAGDSMIDWQTYKTVMQHDCPGVEFEEIDPASIGLTGLEGALVCREGALLAQEPKRFFSSLLREHLRLNHCVQSVKTLADEQGQPSVVEVDGETYDWCIDCTYGQLAARLLGEIRYEVCLTLVYKRKDKNVLHMHHAFTIMDGPFTSLFPCFEDYADATGDLNRLHTLTHVQHTHLKRFDSFAEAQAYAQAFSEADAQRMRPLFEEGILRFLPTFLRDYTYHDYFISYKTKTTGGADGRETVCSTNGRTISVMSGKVNTIFLAGGQAVGRQNAGWVRYQVFWMGGVQAGPAGPTDGVPCMPSLHRAAGCLVQGTGWRRCRAGVRAGAPPMAHCDALSLALALQRTMSWMLSGQEARRQRTQSERASLPGYEAAPVEHSVIR